MPTDELPPGMESTSQVTVVTELPATVAVKAWLWPVVRAARVGPTVTAILLGVVGVGGGVVDCPPPQPSSNKGETRNAEMNRVV